MEGEGLPFLNASSGFDITTGPVQFVEIQAVGI